MSTTMHPLLSDPWFRAKVEAALARHSGRWTDNQRAAFRQAIAQTMSTHPTARRLLLLARPDLAAQLEPAQPGGAASEKKSIDPPDFFGDPDDTSFRRGDADAPRGSSPPPSPPSATMHPLPADPWLKAI